MRFAPALGSALGLSAVVAGAVLVGGGYTPGSRAAAPLPSSSPVAVVDPAAAAADRQTVVSGMNPVTGENAAAAGTGTAAGLEVDRSLLGLPTTPNAPMVQLPELQLTPPTVGRSGSVDTRLRNVQVGTTTVWQPRPTVDGPVRQVRQRAAANGYVVVPAEPGQLHLLCPEGSGTYYVDSHEGEWRVYRADGGPDYDFSYRFVQYDRSLLSAPSRCR